MLSMVEQLELKSGALPLNGKGQQLPCTIWGAGKEIQTSHYDWDGLKRGNLKLSTFQYTIRGCGKLRYESEEYEIPAGHAMLVRFPHNNRYWLPEKWEPWHLIWVTLYGESVQNIWKELEQKKGPVVLIPDDSPIFATYCEISEELFNNPVLSPYKMSSLGYQFAMNVMEELLHPGTKQTSRREIQKVVQYCESHLHQNIGVEEMAEISGLSRYHFTRLFRKIIGMPPGIFLRTLRMRKGARLLRNGQYLVKEVAYHCGFEDTNNFCRAFKKTFGFSPGTWRKN